MTVSEIDFKKYNYKRICILGRTRVHFPPDTEEVLLKEYGDCVLMSEPEGHESGWLVLNVEK